MSRVPFSSIAYHATLLDYMLGSGEPGLNLAYELGRAAFDDHCTLLQVLQVHEQAVSTILDATPTVDELRRRVRVASRFLDETLARYDMACEGYRALTKLRPA